MFSVKFQFKYTLCAGKFKKPQFQKLCFIPPNIIFIEIHSETGQIFRLKKNLGLKKFWFREEFWALKFFAPEKTLVLKKILDGKNFWFEKNF